MPRVWISDNNRVGFGGSPGLSILTGISEGVLAKRQQEEEQKRRDIINRLNETQARTMQVSSDIRERVDQERQDTAALRKRALEQGVKLRDFDIGTAQRLQSQSDELEEALRASEAPFAQRLMEYNDMTPEEAATWSGLITRTDTYKTMLGGFLFGPQDEANLANAQRAGQHVPAHVMREERLQAMAQLGKVKMPGEEPQMSAYMAYQDAAARGDLAGQQEALNVMSGAAQQMGPQGMAALGELMTLARPEAGRGGASEQEWETAKRVIQADIRASIEAQARTQRGENDAPDQHRLNKLTAAQGMLVELYEQEQARRQSPLAGAVDPVVAAQDYAARVEVLNTIIRELESQAPQTSWVQEYMESSRGGGSTAEVFGGRGGG